MFSILKKKVSKIFLWTTFMVAVFGFFLCSNHLIPSHHDNDLFSVDAESSELGECVDKSTYSYNNRNCISEDISFSYDSSSFIEDFIFGNISVYFSDAVRIKSSQGSPIHILHNVLQV